MTRSASLAVCLQPLQGTTSPLLGDQESWVLGMKHAAVSRSLLIKKLSLNVWSIIINLMTTQAPHQQVSHNEAYHLPAIIWYRQRKRRQAACMQAWLKPGSQSLLTQALCIYVCAEGGRHSKPLS